MDICLCTFDTMNTCESNNLKDYIVDQIRIEKWKKSFDEGEYKKNVDLVEKAHKKNLKLVSRRNNVFRRKIEEGDFNILPKIYTRSKSPDKPSKDTKECPEIFVNDFLYLMRCLNDKINMKAKSNDCLEKQTLKNSLVWESPTQILKLLRKCILVRDWANMTSLLLVLIHFDKKYIPIIKNVTSFVFFNIRF